MSQMSYLSNEAVSLAQNVALMTGESMEQVIEVALKERHERLAPVIKPRKKPDLAKIMKIIDESAAIIKENGYTFDFDELYDENGLPK